MSRLAAILLLVLTFSVILSGCASYMFVKEPLPPEIPGYEASVALCTTGKGWVWFDRVMAGVYVLAAASAFSDPERFEREFEVDATTGGLINIGLALVGYSSANSGSKKVDACRAARLEQALSGTDSGPITVAPNSP